MASRNVFENNVPGPDEEDSKIVGDGPHVMLPPLAEGHHYALTKLPSGRSAVIVEEDQQDVSEEEYKRKNFYIVKKEDDLTPSERDMFGRRKL